MPVTHQRSAQLLRLVLFAAVLFVSLAVVSGEGTCVDVIFVGRPGDGKSTLCNIAVGRPVFPGAFKPTHVTTHHASARAPMEWTLGPGVEAVIHDTPGLDQDERYPLHRAELQQSFEKSCGRQLVVFTVGVSSGGRINAHHMQLITAVIRAYNLRPESILFLFNMMPFDVASAADSYMNEVVAALPVELQPYAVNRLAVPYLSELAANYAESINGLGVSSTGRIHEVRKHLQAALSKLTPRSYRLEDPQALESAAETATRLQREREQLEQQRQRAAEALRVAAAEQERARKEQQRLEQERALAAHQAEVAKQQLREAAAKKGSGEPKVIREAGRALRSVRRMLKKLF